MLVADIGNTNIVIGIYSKNKILKVIRINTKNTYLIRSLKMKVTKNTLNKIKKENRILIISSVVPKINNRFIKFFKNLNFKIMNINIKNIPQKIKFNYAPKELGTDRIANTFAAINKYGNNSIIIDFGTATTFDVIKNQTYKGGIIAPGISISHDALVRHAAKLNKISIIKTKCVIGTNTKSSMQIGFYLGYINLINGIIKNIIQDQKFRPAIILTGGLLDVFKDQINYKNFCEPYLTLNGLRLIGKKKYA